MLKKGNKKMEKYFDSPTQVMFWDIDGNHWVAGIAYRNEIICGCCGGTIAIDEIYEFATKEQPIVPYSNWVDITDAIVGGSYPEDFEDR